MFLFGIVVPWEPDASLYRAGVRLWRFTVSDAAGEEHQKWGAGAYIATTSCVVAVVGATLVAVHDGERWSWMPDGVESRRTHALGAGVSAAVEA